MRQMLKNSRKKFKELTRGFEPRNIINLDEAAIFISFCLTGLCATKPK